MQYQDNPFGALPQFGQPGGMPNMAGPTGFTGQSPMGQMGLLEQPLDPQKKRRGMFGGMNPLFGLAGMMGGGGMEAMLPFLLGGLGGGGLFSLLNKHHK